MNKNNGLTDGERLVCVETKLDTVIETQKKTTEKLDKFIDIVNQLLPTYATKCEMENFSNGNEKRIENLKKANRLQSILTNVLVCFFSVLMTSLITFWINNKV